MRGISAGLDCRVDPSKMGLFCGVAFMGAPVILVEKLVGGDEALLAFTRLQQLMASGVCEGGGKVGNERVTVIESTCSYFDGSSFPVYLAKDDDLKNIDVSKEDIQLASFVCGTVKHTEFVYLGGFNKHFMCTRV